MSQVELETGVAPLGGSPRRSNFPFARVRGRSARPRTTKLLKWEVARGARDLLSSRSGEGIPRRTRNLCISSLLEAVRDRVRVVDLKPVNRVLLQPHWRQQQDVPELP